MAFKRKPPPGNVRRVISLVNNFRGVTTNKRDHPWPTGPSSRKQTLTNTVPGAIQSSAIYSSNGLAASPHTTRNSVFHSYAGFHSIPQLRWK
jgi:hypothetical protein